MGELTLASIPCPSPQIAIPKLTPILDRYEVIHSIRDLLSSLYLSRNEVIVAHCM